MCNRLWFVVLCLSCVFGVMYSWLLWMIGRYLFGFLGCNIGEYQAVSDHEGSNGFEFFVPYEGRANFFTSCLSHTHWASKYLSMLSSVLENESIFTSHLGILLAYKLLLNPNCSYLSSSCWCYQLKRKGSAWNLEINCWQTK